MKPKPNPKVLRDLLQQDKQRVSHGFRTSQAGSRYELVERGGRFFHVHDGSPGKRRVVEVGAPKMSRPTPVAPGGPPKGYTKPISGPHRRVRRS